MYVSHDMRNCSLGCLLSFFQAHSPRIITSDVILFINLHCQTSDPNHAFDALFILVLGPNLFRGWDQVFGQLQILAHRANLESHKAPNNIMDQPVSERAQLFFYFVGKYADLSMQCPFRGELCVPRVPPASEDFQRLPMAFFVEECVRVCVCVCVCVCVGGGGGGSKQNHVQHVWSVGFDEWWVCEQPPHQVKQIITQRNIIRQCIPQNQNICVGKNGSPHTQSVTTI